MDPDYLIHQEPADLDLHCFFKMSRIFEKTCHNKIVI